MNQQDMMKMADARIEAAMALYKEEDNHMGLYVALLGINFWKLEAYPGAGHNYHHIQEAIYRYHALHPEDQIGEYYYITLHMMAKRVTNEIQAINLFNLISAELENQKNQLSPFKMDIDELFRVFVNHLLTYEKLRNDKPAIAKIIEYHQYIGQKYGHQLLPESVLKQIISK